MVHCFTTPVTLVMSWLVSLPENVVKLATGKVLNQNVSRYKGDKSHFANVDCCQFRCVVLLLTFPAPEMVSPLCKKYRVWLQVELYPLLVPMDIGLKDQDSSPALPTRHGHTCHQLVVGSTVRL